jgi:uncharacterized protein YpmB
MNKSLRCVLVVIILAVSSVSAQIKIDIKTPIEDKEKLKLAKAGLGAYLQQAEWASIVNFGEDYSVWVRNLKRRFKGNILVFEVDLDLKTRADISTGSLISSRHLQDTVDLTDAANLKTFESREAYEFVEKQLTKNNKYKPITAVVGTVTNVPIAGGVVQQGMKYLGVDVEAQYTTDQAIEAMVLGAVLISNLKEMLDALPAPIPKK